MLAHIHPSSVRFALLLRPVPTHAVLPVRCPGDVLATRDRRVRRAPLPARSVTRTQDNLYGSPQRALPLLHRSYGLMRQTKSLPPTPVSLAVFAGCCRPAGRWPFPTLSLQVFPWMLGPVPRRLAEVHLPVTCLRNIGLPPLGPRSAPRNPVQRLLNGPDISGRQSFTNVQASEFASHPGRSYRCGLKAHRAAVAFTSEQNTCRYLHAHRIC